MSHTIRQAGTKDIEQLACLFDAYRVFYAMGSDVEAAKLFLLARMEKSESIIYVAENEKDKLMGFVQLYPLFSSTRIKRLWLLNDLFVDPDYRSKGVSVDLIERTKQLCRESGSGGMMLETGKTNIIGNQLYLRTGWELDKDHNYYSWDIHTQGSANSN